MSYILHIVRRPEHAMRNFVRECIHKDELVVKFQHRVVLDGDTTHLFKTVDDITDHRIDGYCFIAVVFENGCELPERLSGYVNSRIRT